MGFFDSFKDALGGERDDQSPPPETTAETARHVDREAREESEYGAQVTGGKHRA
jgi:hypothetical protein